MSDVVEHAAKAAHGKARELATLWGANYRSWGELPNEAKRAAMQCQRAAIEALREPGERILDAGAKFVDPEGPGLWVHKMTTAGDIWRAMIDELLRD